MNEKWKTIVGNKQMNPFRGDLSVAPCVVSACGNGGGMTPMVTTFPQSVLKEKWFIELIRGHIMDNSEEKKKTVIHLPKDAEGKTMRIRKLTPRECFRLMDVPEDKIDLMMQKNEKGEQLISNSRLYHLAGNSIVVSCMAEMFEGLFYGSEPVEGEQLLLF